MRRLLILATFLLLAPSAWAQCTTNATGSPGAFSNEAFPAAQSGTFETTFTVEMAGASNDGVVMLASGDAADDPGGYSDGAVIVQFNSSGVINARNGASYTNDATVNWSAATVYPIRMVVDFSAETYDVFVDDGGETQIADDYDFRSDWTGGSSLDTWAIHAPVGSMEVCSLAITSPGNQQTPSGIVQTQGPLQVPGPVQAAF